MADVYLTALVSAKLCNEKECKILSYLFFHQSETDPNVLCKELGMTARTFSKATGRLWRLNWINIVGDKTISLNVPELKEVLTRLGEYKSLELLVDRIKQKIDPKTDSVPRQDVNPVNFAKSQLHEGQPYPDGAGRTTASTPQNPPPPPTPSSHPTCFTPERFALQPQTADPPAPAKKPRPVKAIPTQEEAEQYIAAYVQRKVSEGEVKFQNIDPHYAAQRFYDFYSSKGWVVGRSPMKDWQAAARNCCMWQDILASRFRGEYTKQELRNMPSAQKEALDKLYELRPEDYTVYNDDGTVNEAETFTKQMRLKTQYDKMRKQGIVPPRANVIEAEVVSEEM